MARPATPSPRGPSKPRVTHIDTEEFADEKLCPNCGAYSIGRFMADTGNRDPITQKPVRRLTRWDYVCGTEWFHTGDIYITPRCDRAKEASQ